MRQRHMLSNAASSVAAFNTKSALPPAPGGWGAGVSRVTGLFNSENEPLSTLCEFWVIYTRPAHAAVENTQ
jgi:hypothetical protein